MSEKARILENMADGTQQSANVRTENERRCTPDVYCKVISGFLIATFVVLSVFYLYLCLVATTDEDVKDNALVAALYVGLAFLFFVIGFHKRREFCSLWNAFLRHHEEYLKLRIPYMVPDFRDRRNQNGENQVIYETITETSDIEGDKVVKTEISNPPENTQAVQSASREKGRILESSVSSQVCTAGRISEVASTVSRIVAETLDQKVPQTSESSKKPLEQSTETPCMLGEDSPEPQMLKSSRTTLVCDRIHFTFDHLSGEKSVK